MFCFDTHIHLQDFDNQDIFSILNGCNIKQCICISAKQSDWQKVADIYEKYPDIVVPSFGLHPWYANQKSLDWQDKLEYFLNKYQNCVIGECGFDSLKNVSYEEQKEVFTAQIQLANKYKKSIIIHAVKSDNWLNDIWKILPEKFVFHSFNSRTDLLKKISDYGGYVALNKKILKNKQASNIILSIDAKKILIESDAPYQSQPEDLLPLIKSLADIRNEKLEHLANRLYTNAQEFVKYEK